MTRTNPQPGIPAKHATDCPRCERPIDVGARIAFLRGRPIHCRCCGGGDDE